MTDLDTPTQHAPFDQDVERAIVAGGLFGPAARTLLLDELAVTPDEFYVDVHRALWAAVRHLDRTGTAIDVGTVADAVRRHPDWTDGHHVDLDLVRRTAGELGLAYTAADLGHHVTILRDLADRRRLLQTCHETMAGIWGERPAHEVRAAAQAALADTATAHLDDSLVSASAAVGDALTRWETPVQFAGLPTGFVAIDDVLGGMRPGQLIVLGARPAMGKSALALDICRHAAIRTGVPVLLVSMEMSSDELTDRFAAAEASIPGRRLQHGRATPDDQATLLGLADVRGVGNLYWTDRTDLSVDDIAALARALAGRHDGGLGLVAVDYIQLLRPAVRRQQNNRTNDVSEMSRGLKILAGQLGVPVLALSQLSRASEQRPNKRPMLSDLRESGSLEQDANAVLLLHRDDYYNDDAPPGIAEVIVAKNRSGRIGDARLLLQDTYPRFAPAPGTAPTEPYRGPVPLPPTSGTKQEPGR